MSIDIKADYYDVGGIEVMKIIKAKLTHEQFKGFLLGNQIKYLARSNFKGNFKRDIEKSGIYSKLLLELEDGSCGKCSTFKDGFSYNFCPSCGRGFENEKA